MNTQPNPTDAEALLAFMVALASNHMHVALTWDRIADLAKEGVVHHRRALAELEGEREAEWEKRHRGLRQNASGHYIEPVPGVEPPWDLLDPDPEHSAIPPMPPSDLYHVGPNDPIRHRSRAWRQMEAYLRQFPGVAAQLDATTLKFIRSIAAGEYPLPKTCAEYVAPQPQAFSETTKRTKFVVEFESREAAEAQARKAAAWEYLRARLRGMPCRDFCVDMEYKLTADAIATGALPIPGKGEVGE